MSEPRQIGEARDYPGLAALIRARIAELELANETVDAVAGLPLRYSQKILSMNPAKQLGRQTLGPLLSTLGLKVIVAIDTEQAERWERLVKDRLERRKQAPAGQPKYPPRGRKAKNTDASIPTAKKRRKTSGSFTPETARIAAQRRLLVTTPDERRQRARKAIRCRWARKRREKGRKRKQVHESGKL